MQTYVLFLRRLRRKISSDVDNSLISAKKSSYPHFCGYTVSKNSCVRGQFDSSVRAFSIEKSIAEYNSPSKNFFKTIAPVTSCFLLPIYLKNVTAKKFLARFSKFFGIFSHRILPNDYFYRIISKSRRKNCFFDENQPFIWRFLNKFI